MVTKTKKQTHFSKNEQRLEELKTKLAELENVRLPKIIKKYGEATQSSSDSWHQSASFEIADEEVAVVRAMIIGLKKEILKLEKEIHG